MDQGAAAILLLLLTLFGIIVAILWVFVPFLIMGTNKRLDKIVAQNAALLESLGTLLSHTRRDRVTGLIRCNECGKEHNESAAVCPHCGFRRANNTPA